MSNLIDPTDRTGGRTLSDTAVQSGSLTPRPNLSAPDPSLSVSHEEDGTCLHLRGE